MKKDSWLYSDSFLKRAFAIWGYHFVANIIISIPFMILWFAFMAMFIGVASKHGFDKMDRMDRYDRADMMDWEDDSGMKMQMQVR